MVATSCRSPRPAPLLTPSRFLPQVRDIVVFLGLMFVVYAGYAVALYSVLYQDRNWDQFTLIDMAFIPYFQVSRAAEAGVRSSGQC